MSIERQAAARLCAFKAGDSVDWRTPSGPVADIDARIIANWIETYGAGPYRVESVRDGTAELWPDLRIERCRDATYSDREPPYVTIVPTKTSAPGGSAGQATSASSPPAR